MSAQNTTGAKPVSPEKRKQLQALFAKGSQVSATGNFDYATEMFTQCVLADPGNRIYAENLVGNLQKKYGNNKKGVAMASLRTGGAKANVKKCSTMKQHLGVLQSGIEVLKLNPWDAGTLMDMAAACRELGHDETEICYYDKALDLDPKDPEVNYRQGLAYERQGNYAKAIVCMQRVREGRPNDHNIPRIISNLTVQESIRKNKMEDAKSAQDVRNRDGDIGPKKLSPEEQLEKDLVKDPKNVGKWLELSDRYRMLQRFADAQRALERGLEASGGDPTVQERLEDVQLNLKREEREQAQADYDKAPSPALQEQLKQKTSALFQFEIEYYRGRSERYPSQLDYRFYLAEKLKQTGDYKGAIENYQRAKGDVSRKGVVLTELGICFYAIKQLTLAMNHFKEAVELIPDNDEDNKKRALYLAGKCAMALKDWTAAKAYLNKLAGMDYAYKDVADLLEKLAELEGQA